MNSNKPLVVGVAHSYFSKTTLEKVLEIIKEKDVKCFGFELTPKRLDYLNSNSHRLKNAYTDRLQEGASINVKFMFDTYELAQDEVLEILPLEDNDINKKQAESHQALFEAGILNNNGAQIRSITSDDEVIFQNYLLDVIKRSAVMVKNIIQKGALVNIIGASHAIHIEDLFELNIFEYDYVMCVEDISLEIVQSYLIKTIDRLSNRIEELQDIIDLAKSYAEI